MCVVNFLITHHRIRGYNNPCLINIWFTLNVSSRVHTNLGNPVFAYGYNSAVRCQSYLSLAISKRTTRLRLFSLQPFDLPFMLDRRFALPKC
jgi:hypothetical protein